MSVINKTEAIRNTLNGKVTVAKLTGAVVELLAIVEVLEAKVYNLTKNLPEELSKVQLMEFLNSIEFVNPLSDITLANIEFSQKGEFYQLGIDVEYYNANTDSMRKMLGFVSAKARKAQHWTKMHKCEHKGDRSYLVISVGHRRDDAPEKF
jgi:hypothetical protein